jgi:hypothetical protein
MDKQADTEYRNEIIEMARQAGFYDGLFSHGSFQHHLKAFAKLVAERERETCAKHLESMSNAPDMKAYADSIRARGGEAK